MPIVAVQFELLDGVRDPRIDQVKAILREHNYTTNPAFMADAREPVPLVVIGSTRDEAVVGGLIGETRGRWARIHIMGVQPELRRSGVGRTLLRAAEAEARRRRCDRIYLETMSNQAPAFYEACGYAQRCALDDWDSHGHTKLVFTKQLVAESSA